LAKDGALVQVGGYKVCGYADDFYSLVIRLAVGGGTGEGGQERRMNIKNPIFPVPDEIWRKNFHKAGEDDEINGRFLQMRLEGGFGFGPIAVVDESKGKSIAAGEGAKLGVISCEENRFGREVASFPRTEDGLGCMRLFGYEDSKALAGSGRIGKAKSELHPKLPSEREELGADLLLFKF